MAQPDLSFLDIEAGKPPRDLSKLKLNKDIEVVHGNLDALAPKVRQFIIECADLCTPSKIHICDGTEEENMKMKKELQDNETIKPLTAYEDR